jgi:hypothetical protein
MVLKVWIAEIRMSERVAAKIKQKHGVTPNQVDEACMFFGYRAARWDVDADRGSRLIVRGADYDGIPLIVVLKPVNVADGIFKCVTAWRDT